MKRTVVLEIASGINRGKKIFLSEGTCKVIGRALQEGDMTSDQTEILTRDIEICLEGTNLKKVNQFLNKNEKSVTASDKLHNPYKRTADFIIIDPNISRVHAMVFNGKDISGIIDLASTNGTFIDGARIDVASLKGGELIVLGNTEINFIIET
jgi:hypothetical protein